MSSAERPTGGTDSSAQPQPDPLRYPSDLTDEQWYTGISLTLTDPAWAAITESVPDEHRIPNPQLNITSPRRLARWLEIEAQRRAVVNAIRYRYYNGCEWSQLPADFPPSQQVAWYSQAFQDREVLDRVLADLPFYAIAPPEGVQLTRGSEADVPPPLYASAPEPLPPADALLPPADGPSLPGYSPDEQRGSSAPTVFSFVGRAFRRVVQRRSESGAEHAASGERRRSSMQRVFSSIGRTFRGGVQSHEQAQSEPERGRVAERESDLPPAYVSEFGQQGQVAEPRGSGAQLGSGAGPAPASPGVDPIIHRRRLVHQRSIEADLQDQTQRRSAEYINDGQGNDGL